MHDLDLIETDVIRKLRDDPPEVRWAKLMKDGPRKAHEALRRRRIALKAVAARQANQLARAGKQAP
jgi:hypothetical protein